MRRRYLCLILALLLAVAALSAGCLHEEDDEGDSLEPAPSTTPHEADPDPPEEPEQPEVREQPEPVEVELTEEMLDRWIASTEDADVARIVETVAAATDKDDLLALKRAVENLAGNADLDEAAKAYEFAGAPEWVQVTLKVMAGYLPARQQTYIEALEAMGMDKGHEEYKARLEDMEKEIAKIRSELGKLPDSEYQVVLDKVDDIQAIWDGQETEDDQ